MSWRFKPTSFYSTQQIQDKRQKDKEHEEKWKKGKEIEINRSRGRTRKNTRGNSSLMIDVNINSKCNYSHLNWKRRLQKFLSTVSENNPPEKNPLPLFV